MKDIILADDHAVVRNGIKLLLESTGDFNIIGECDNGAAVVKLLEAGHLPDLIITDYSMPVMDGLELIKYVRKSNYAIKMIVLSMVDRIENVKTAITAGADGYLLKTDDMKELLFGFDKIKQGDIYFSSNIAVKVLRSTECIEAKSKNVERIIKDLTISKRELEVLKYVMNGCTTQEIADQLFVSKRTVEGHRQKLLDKTNSKNYVQLIKFTIQHQLVPVNEEVDC